MTVTLQIKSDFHSNLCLRRKTTSRQEVVFNKTCDQVQERKEKLMDHCSVQTNLESMQLAMDLWLSVCVCV